MAAPTVHVSLTAQDAPLGTRRNINVEGARVRRKVAYNHTIPFTSSASDDTHMMLRMNSCDRIVALHAISDGGGANLTADLGLYPKGETAVANTIDQDAFFSDVALNGPLPLAGAIVNYAMGGVLTALTYGQALWEAVAGLSVDPFTQYDIGFTVTTALITTDCIIGLECLYTAGD